MNEFLAGSDPTDAGSRFEIVQLVANPSSTELTLSWSSVPGRNYRIMSSSDLGRDSWQSVEEAAAEAAPATHTARSFSISAESRRRFYRVEIVR